MPSSPIRRSAAGPTNRLQLTTALDCVDRADPRLPHAHLLCHGRASSPPCCCSATASGGPPTTASGASSFPSSSAGSSSFRLVMFLAALGRGGHRSSVGLHPVRQVPGLRPSAASVVPGISDRALPARGRGRNGRSRRCSRKNVRALLLRLFRSAVQSPWAPLIFAVPSFLAMLLMKRPWLEDPPSFVPVVRIVVAYAIPFAFGWLLFLNADLLETLSRRAWLYAAVGGGRERRLPCRLRASDRSRDRPSISCAACIRWRCGC